MLQKLFNKLQDDSNLHLLPPEQLRKMGYIYGGYRFLISIFLFLSSYTTVFKDNVLLVNLPSFLHQITLLFYAFFSLLLLALFHVIPNFLRRQIGIGLIFDVLIISLLLYLSGTPDIQLIMLYVVVVAASFIMLAPYQAFIITLLAIIFVIYQQFYFAVSNSMSISDLGNTLLLSLSFLGVGFLSWYISQRLAKVEKIAAAQADEVAKLSLITQQVVQKISHGVIVLTDKLALKLTNHAAVFLLDLQLSTKIANNVNCDSIASAEFMQQLAKQHPQLFMWLNNVTREIPSVLNYEINHTNSMISKLRFNSTPLDDGSLLIVIEDIQREQANAQQLKLAALGQLTASIAHEIRNPLAAISQASQLLIEEVESVSANESSFDSTASFATESTNNDDDIPDDSNIELYRMIYNQTKRVNRIIEDVLNLSRQAKPNLITIELVSWLDNFIKEHFSSHDIFIHASCHPSIKFDIHQLEQILINLITNGLRYSSRAHPHAYVEIEIECLENDVIIDVLDTGKGVEQQFQANLFNPFFTTDSDGTGLGLYLSQAFTEANNARLLFVPEHKKTCFRMVIPKIL